MTYHVEDSTIKKKKKEKKEKWKCEGVVRSNTFDSREW
jgi:hypothetical protein